jgi:hypothetical protein
VLERCIFILKLFLMLTFYFGYEVLGRQKEIGERERGLINVGSEEAAATAVIEVPGTCEKIRVMQHTG